MVKDNELQSPAYVSFTTFLNFVKRLKETTIPPVIDNTVLVGMSGASQSQLKTSLRFLKLTDGTGSVTQQLRELVMTHGDPAAWKSCWDDIISNAYGSITETVDLDAGTLGQLRDAFRDQGGAGGSVLVKAVRFYLAALEEAQWTYSPHFKTRGASGSAARSSKTNENGASKKKRRTKKATSGSGDELPRLPADWQRFELPLKSAEGKVRIDLPEAMSKREWKYLRNTIEGYFGLVWGEEEETE